MYPYIDGAESKRYQEIFIICNIGYENLLNLNWYKKKFHNPNPTIECFIFQSLGLSSCYPQQGGVSNENTLGNNNLYMRPGRWHNYYNPAHYYYPTYWRPQTPAPAPVIQTPSFPRQQQTPESGCSGNTACASACLKVSNKYSHVYFSLSNSP